MPDFGAAFAEFLARATGGGGVGLDWEQARSTAAAIASGGAPEPNIDPLARMGIESLLRVAELQVANVTGLQSPHLSLTAVTRGQWAASTVDDYRPMLEQVATSVANVVRSQLGDLQAEDLDDAAVSVPGLGEIDLGALIRGVTELIGPGLAVSLSATVVGQLASRAFGTYDLPLPRPEGSTISVVLTSLDDFGTEWSLPADDLRMWWCLHEVTHHLVLGVDFVRSRLTALLGAHAGAFDPDPDALADSLGDVDLSDPASFGRWSELMAQPDRLLATIRSAEQTRLVGEIDTLTSCVIGYVDWVVDSIGSKLLSESDRIAEALRRRRVEADSATRFVERIFGLELTQSKIDRGRRFVDTVAARLGHDAVAELWTDVAHLPTDAELETPGLWIARLGLADDEPLPELGEDIEIPDAPEF